MAELHGPGRVTRKLGRLRRIYDPRVPHMSALLAGQALAPPPASCDWTRGMPADLGMMLNDTLGDCTCAAVYHAMQVWSFNTRGTIDTEPDGDVEELYELACGYDPSQGGEGPGGVEQNVLGYLLDTGAPVGPAGQALHKIAGFVEIDPRHTDDVKRAINDCGLVYIGFAVPQNVMPQGGVPPAVWDVDPSNPPTIGGHAVILPGYDASGVKVISWGQVYTMTWDFFARYTDEVYAIADPTWVNAKGTSPGGLSLTEIEQQMQAIREG